MAKSCKFLALVLPSKVASLPDPLLDIFAWEEAWRSAPGMWRLLVKACARAAGDNPWQAAACLREAGLNVQSVDVGDGDDDIDEFLCSDCGTWWPSKGSLVQHRRRAHGDTGLADLARSVAIDSVCPACGVIVFSRVRVCRHLKWGAAGCKEAMMSGALLQASPEAVILADQQDRALRVARRKVGLSAVAGPRVSRGG